MPDYYLAEPGWMLDYLAEPGWMLYYDLAEFSRMLDFYDDSIERGERRKGPAGRPAEGTVRDTGPKYE
ncbi:MAG: hypothetical protein ACOX8B_05345 [Lachnospiraceae bacterium]|jgi:hypothetical protein